MLGNILNSVASNVLGSDGASKAMQLLQALLNNSEGGLQGIIAKLQNGGLGELLQSWIGNGENLPVSVQQILEVFGVDTINKAADEAGVEQAEAPNLIAEYLPKIVNKLSPNGELDVSSLNTNDLLAQGAKAVLGKLFS